MKTFAFFDVDGTVVNMTTMIDFLRYAQSHRAFPRRAAHTFATLNWRISKRLLQRETVNRLYYRIFEGSRVDDIMALGIRWFDECLERGALVFNTEVLSHLRQHQHRQHEIVFVSGSFAPCLEPLARHLGVCQMLCVQPRVVDGVFTGDIQRPQTIGQGKAEAVLQHLSRNGCTVDDCGYAYGDHLSDVPMLSLAQHPMAVIGDPALRAHALRHSWKILSGATHANH